MNRFTHRAGAAITAAAVIVACLPGSKAAASTPGGGLGQVRFLHAWPDQDELTILNGGTATGPVRFGSATDYRPADPGPSTVEVHRAKVVIARFTLDARPDDVTVALVGGPAPPFVVLPGSSPAPPDGQALLRLANLAEAVPAATATTSGPPTPSVWVSGSVATRTAGPYQLAPPGQHLILGGPHGQAAFLETSLTIGAGTASTIALVGGGETPIRLVWLPDATGLTRIPTGYPAMGAPPGQNPGDLGPVSLLLLLIAALVAWIVGGGRRRPHPSRRPPRTILALVAVLVTAATVTGCGPAAQAPPPDAAPRAPAAPATTVTGTTVPRLVQPSGAAARTAGAGDGPVRVELPTQNAAGAVEPMALTTDGQLPLLPTAERNGWIGTPPDRPGLLVIAGHVNYNGKPGALAGLPRLATGDPVQVTTRAGARYTYIVTRVEVLPKTRFEAERHRLYRPAPAGTNEVLLLSCTGTLVANSYLDNVAVRARKAPA